MCWLPASSRDRGRTGKIDPNKSVRSGRQLPSPRYEYGAGAEGRRCVWLGLVWLFSQQAQQAGPGLLLGGSLAGLAVLLRKPTDFLFPRSGGGGHTQNRNPNKTMRAEKGHTPFLWGEKQSQNGILMSTNCREKPAITQISANSLTMK